MNNRLCLSALLFAFALQTGCAQRPVQPEAAANAAATPQDGTQTTVEKGQRIERIRHSDAGSTIDEVREGGETKSITVKPANNLPSYEITPDQRNSVPGNPGNPGGQRVWKIFKF